MPTLVVSMYFDGRMILEPVALMPHMFHSQIYSMGQVENVKEAGTSGGICEGESQAHDPTSIE